jgi:hypothetical protein
VKTRVIQLAVAVVLIAAFFAGGNMLRNETLTRHDKVDPRSTLRVEMTVAARGAEAEEASLALSLISLCQVEVAAGLVPGSFSPEGPHRYAFVMTPSLDDADRKQLHGCLQDMRLDHFLAHVVDMTHRPSPPAPPPGQGPPQPGPP